MFYKLKYIVAVKYYKKSLSNIIWKYTGYITEVTLSIRVKVSLSCAFAFGQ